MLRKMRHIACPVHIFSKTCGFGGNSKAYKATSLLEVLRYAYVSYPVQLLAKRMVCSFKHLKTTFLSRAVRFPKEH